MIEARMQTLRWLLVMACLPWFVTACVDASGNRPPPPHLCDAMTLEQASERFTELQQQTENLPWRARASRLAGAYEQCFAKYQSSQSTLAGMPLHSLDMLRRAASTMAFYSSQSRYVSEVATDLRILAAKHAATPEGYAVLYRLYVQTREFSLARALLAAHPSLPVTPLPRVLDRIGTSTDGPSVLVPERDAAGLALVRTPVHLNPGRQIVVVAHPLCHFTGDAVRALVQNSSLWRALAQHAIWIAPQDGRLDASVFQQWNQSIHGAPIYIAYKQKQWHFIDSWATPTFYFLKHGAVVSKVVGWPAKGNADDIMSAMHKIGVYPDTTKPATGARNSESDAW